MTAKVGMQCVVAFWGMLVAQARYGLIVDAGSTGSRLLMFNLTQGIQPYPPNKADEDFFKSEPGLSSYKDNAIDAGPALKSMLDKAAEYIPQEEHSTTKLWVRGTAGLRLMDPLDADRVLTAVNRYLGASDNCPFDFVNAEILSGTDEGAFAWIAMNYLLGVIESPKKQVGILDLGGASFQIALKPSGFIAIDEFPFYVGQDKSSIYATSIMRFGIQEAIKRAQEALARRHIHTHHFDFPCYHRGYELDTTTLGRPVKFVGTGNNSECAALAYEMLHADYECMLEPCPFMGRHIPKESPHTQFYGISNFFNVANGMGLVGWDDLKTISPAMIEEAARGFCDSSVADIMALPRYGTPDFRQPYKYLKDFCFGGHFLVSIVKAIGIKDDSPQITVARTFKGQSADWTLGTLLIETEYMPHRLLPSSPPCSAASAVSQAALVSASAHQRTDIIMAIAGVCCMCALVVAKLLHPSRRSLTEPLLEPLAN